MKVLVAGASGFVGTELLQHLAQLSDMEVRAFARRPKTTHLPNVSWVAGDLFSLKDIEEAMLDCDTAIYLVHSMSASADLVQGTFYDCDLLIADNFARAAQKVGVKHILYLGGLIPDEQELSWHLKSRVEVEQTLRSYGVRTTVLRAGIILGHDGSSFNILRRLVERLPVVPYGSWAKVKTQPIDLHDLIRVFLRTISDPLLQGKTWDVGGPDQLSYQQMLQETAEELKLNRSFIPVEGISLRFSRGWISLLTQAPRGLVYPLVMSLRHEMLVHKERQFPDTELTKTSFRQSLKRSLQTGLSRNYVFAQGYSNHGKEVRSVQRMVLPEGKDARWVTEEYFRWLPRFFFAFIRAKVIHKTCFFYVLHPAIKILEMKMSDERSTPDRQLMYVTGGLLAAKQYRGRLEFREVLGRKQVLAALHEFRPALPWYIYRWTQAIIHLIVMYAFGRYLRRYKELL